MEKSLWTRKKNAAAEDGEPRDVLKDYTVRTGRDSPESGSLYSDYESGQQYEDKVRQETLVTRTS